MFAKLGERVLYEGRIISLAIGTFAAPDGSSFDRDVVHHPGAVGVVPVHEDGTVILVRQYRAPLDAEILEIPAGIRDVDGEPPELTAARELAEEVGMRAGSTELLCRFHNSPGFSDEEVFVYLAQGLSETEDDRQGIEEQHLRIERVNLWDVPSMIANGEITDAKTIIGLTLTLARSGPVG